MIAIKTRRKKLKMKRQTLAEEAGVSVSTLWRIEEGKSNASPLVARALEEALSVREALQKAEVAS